MAICCEGRKTAGAEAPLLLCQNRRGESSSTLASTMASGGENPAALRCRNKVSVLTTQRGLENTHNVGKEWLLCGAQVCG